MTKVSNWRDLGNVIGELRHEFETNRGEWENPTLEGYIEAVKAWLIGSQRKKEEPPTWDLIARMLWGARIRGQDSPPTGAQNKSKGETTNLTNWDITNVTTWKDLVEVISELHDELHTNPEAWENLTLEDYLEAMQAWLTDFQRKKEEPPTWYFMARMLCGASRYE